MPVKQTPRVFRVFVSSPGDVGEERAAVRELLDRELKQDPSFRGKVSFEVVSWDDPSAPVPMMAGLTPQEAVNRFRGKPSDCDVVIVILWSRLGTPLMIDDKVYVSGTVYEYEDAYYSNPQPDILVYRRTEVLTLEITDPRRDEKIEHYELVQQFFDRFRNADGSFQGGVNEYATPTDFKELLEKNLREILTERLQAEQVSRPAPASAEPPVWQDAPYPGLRAFTRAEAAIFFGRGRETDALVAELRKPNRRFTAVVGASGAGKSSLVYAGLLPRLAEGAIEGSANWHALCFKPGAFGDNPFLSLAAELRSLLPTGARDEPIAIAEDLANAPGRIAAYVDQALATAPLSAGLVLFVDQSEEFLAQVAASRREPFVNLLAEATGHPQVQVVLAMRADFLPQATGYPRLAALLQTGTFILGAPGLAALADMIRRPAQLAGLAFDEDLADEILKDVGSEPGALPLLAFCLERLYVSSGSSRHLTRRAYESLGRLQGVVRQHGDEILSPLQQRAGVDLEPTLSKLFSGLVHVDATGAVSRRRASRDGLTTDSLLQKVVMALEKGRLLVAEGEAHASISLAHEVLLTAWPELEAWVKQNRARLQRLDRALSSLDSVDSLDRKYAVQLLGEFGTAVPQAVSALITALADPDASVRERAAWALVRIGPPAVLALVTALGDANENVRGLAAGALRHILPRAAEAVPALIAALADANQDLRRSVVRFLGQVGPPAAQAVPALIATLADANESARDEVAWALGQIGPRAVEAVPALITALSDASEDVRRSAAWGLGRIGRPAVAVLVTALSDASENVRRSAAWGLEQIGPPAVPALITALGDANEDARRLAVGVLEQIGPPAVPALITALGDANEDARRLAVGVLEQIGRPAEAAVPALITALGDPNECVRGGAARALGHIRWPPAKAVSALIAALGDANEDVRRSAAGALAQIGWHAVPALEAARADKSEQVRNAAARALRVLQSRQ